MEKTKIHWYIAIIEKDGMYCPYYGLSVSSNPTFKYMIENAGGKIVAEMCDVPDEIKRRVDSEGVPAYSKVAKLLTRLQLREEKATNAQKELDDIYSGVVTE